MPGPERWIDLCDPDEPTLAAALPIEVHATAMDRLRGPRVTTTSPGPRLEAHGNYVFGVLVLPTIDDDGDVTCPRDRRRRDARPPRHRAQDAAGRHRVRHQRRSARPRSATTSPPGLCLYYLFDEIAERFLTVVDRFDDEIDELEDNVGDWPSARGARAASRTIRHEILEVRRVLTPTRDAARAVLDDRVELDGDVTLFPRDVELHFADAYDKLLRATDGLDLARDLLAGVRDFHQAQVANDQNEVMKRLTVVASVLLRPDVHRRPLRAEPQGVPEFRWAHGYLFSWGLIIVTTIAQLVYYRRKRWI